MSSMNKSVRDYNWADVIMVSDSIFLEEKERKLEPERKIQSRFSAVLRALTSLLLGEPE
jgi:hypothetical protein